MISFEDVSRRFGTVNALTDVSFTVPSGQVLGLLGQNGAGKTTAMRILTGCLSPSRGRVSIGGYDMMTSPRQAKRLIGYLPENAPLYDEMSVRAYLRFACDLREVALSAMDAHIDQIARKTGLADVLSRRIGNLSKGFRQRVGLAQALCGNPQVLVLDEPTAGLDPLQTVEFRELIKALGQTHTVLFSSHILSEVQAVCDRVLILKKGKLLCDTALNFGLAEEKRLRVTIAQGRDSLLPALRQLKSVTRAELVPEGEPGTTTVLLTAPRDTQPERELFTLLCGLQAPILRLTPVENSLEDIFLRATKDA